MPDSDIDLDKEKRAYEMLRWVPYSFPADFNMELALLGTYSKAQKERSDIALDEFEKQHPYQSSAELDAFRKLEDLGRFTQKDYYSPHKAKDNYYTSELERYTRITRSGNSPREPKRFRGNKKTRRLFSNY
tara:strand:+ start:967 stop:1359 length:393 start_codon:yes stop_codon:yes gene_type:complete